MQSLNILQLNCSGQFIDLYGKVRSLNYDEGITLYTTPLPIFRGIVQTSEVIKNSQMQDVRQFLKNRKTLYIREQVSRIGENKNIEGIWLASTSEPNFNGFIFVKSPKLKNIKISNNFFSVSSNYYDQTSSESELEKFKKCRIISNLLKDCIFYLYSLNKENFSEKNIIVDPNHKYDQIPKYILGKNNCFFDKKTGNLVVQSNDIKQKLLSQVEIQKKINYEKLISTSSNYFFDTDKIYSNISSYQNKPKTILFSNTENLTNWKKHKKVNKNYIYDSLNFFLKEPYLFVFHDKIYLFLQNVFDDSLESCLDLGKYFLKYNENPGYEVKSEKPFDKNEVVDYQIITMKELLATISKEYSVDLFSSLKVNILEESGKFCCILYFNGSNGSK